MGKTLTEIAQELKDSRKKVQLIYAFNGTGKTRLSREFTRLVSAGATDADADPSELASRQALYYSAFTEDLFYWDNDLAMDSEPRLMIQHTSFIEWVLETQEQEPEVINTFQRYTNDKLSPRFNADYSWVMFSFQRGNDDHEPYIKISKGEESSFIWSIFYALLKQIAATHDDSNTRSTYFSNLTHIFIDDPVTSLDENHVIELAVDLAKLVRTSPEHLNYLITTHSPLFYNVLHNELGQMTKEEKGKHKKKPQGRYILEKLDGETYELSKPKERDNTQFAYHLHLLNTLESAVDKQHVERYHFTLLRNIYEKTACFLDYEHWSDLLPEPRAAYLKRIVDFTSHSDLSNEQVPQPTIQEKASVGFLLEHLKNNIRFHTNSESKDD